MFCIVPAMGAMCCWVSASSLSSSFLSWFWCWWLLGLSVSSRKSPRLRQWLHPRRCGGRVWKRGQQSRSWSNLFTACLCSRIRFFSVRSVSPICKLGKVLTRNFIHNPFLLFSWYWVFRLHQHLSHCSEGFEDNLQLGGSMSLQVFSIFSDTPFMYGRHKTCTLLSSVFLSFTISSSSLSLSSSFLSLGSWPPSFLTVTSLFLSPFCLIPSLLESAEWLPLDNRSFGIGP